MKKKFYCTLIDSSSKVFFCFIFTSVKEILPALAVLDVLHPDVDALGQDLAAHALVDHHAHCALGHVEHAPGLAVVRLVRHALLECTAA